MKLLLLWIFFNQLISIGAKCISWVGFLYSKVSNDHYNILLFKNK